MCDNTSSRSAIVLGMGLLLTQSLALHPRQTRAQSGPILNEILAWNVHTALGPDRAGFPDYIELHNPTADPIDLEGWYLSDDRAAPFKARIPGGVTLPAGGYLLLWANGHEPFPFLPFQIKREGEEIVLTRPDGTPADAIRFGPQVADISYGRPADGPAWAYLAYPSPGAPNPTEGFPTPHQAAPPSVSLAGGLYDGPVSIEILTQSGHTIRYSLDGSIPGHETTPYTGPIPITQSTTLRFRAFADGLLPSDIVTQTYLVGLQSPLPVVSLATNPEWLFHEEVGITHGVCMSPEIGTPPPFDMSANYWTDWERPAHLELFIPGQGRVVSQEVGIQVFGGLYGRQICQKAFSIHTRDTYGSDRITYPVFRSKPIERFGRLLIRASSNDYNLTRIRDAMMNALVAGRMDIDYQAYEPALGFINGQFWGLYNIREKMDRFFAESNFGVDPDRVDLLEDVGIVVSGSPDHYDDLLRLVEHSDPNDPGLAEQVRRRMDVDEYINYMLAQIFFRNHDWLRHNTKYWREQSSQGRWRWMLFDLDWGFSGEPMQGPDQWATNSLAWALSQGEPSRLFAGLMRSAWFREEFAQRFAMHLNTTFRTERVIHIIDSLAAGIESVMPLQIERWNAPVRLQVWMDELELLSEFARKRPEFAFQHLRETLALPPYADLSASVDPPHSGRLAIQGVQHDGPVFHGRFFRHIPVRLFARAHPGWVFDHWEGPLEEREGRTVVSMGDDTQIRAVFRPADAPTVVINEIHYNPSDSLQGEDEAWEFVELHNPSSQSVDLTGFRFVSGIDFTFPAGSLLEAGGYAVVVAAAAGYEGRGFPVYEWTSGRLANEGEDLVLFDAHSQMVDSVRYNDRDPWPEAADGDGPSLELTDATLDNGLPSSWSASGPLGGTPGRPNSGTSTAGEPTLEPPSSPLGLEVYPNPFEEVLHLRLRLPEPEIVQLTVFDALGRRVDGLLDGPLAAGVHALLWDGRSESGGEVGPGVYFIRLETARKSLVVAAIRTR